MAKIVLKDSKFQSNIFKYIKEETGNLSIEARAGSGKTTTIVRSLEFIPENKQTLFLAFNRDIAAEIKLRVPHHIDVFTTHSFGWRAMLRFFNKPKMEMYKVLEICKATVKVDPKTEFQYFFQLSKLIDLYRQNLCESMEDLQETADMHNLTIGEEEINHLNLILPKVLNSRTKFDFVDMIYQSAVNTKIRIKQYDYVFVDEAQDLNRAQHLLVNRALHRRSRLISVGDPKQAIYGFAGSDTRSFERFQQHPNTTTLPLSICYRCAINIVIEAQTVVPDIEYDPNQIPGIVREGEIGELKDGDWVLCRNVKPLVILFFQLLKNGRKCYIQGEDIALKIINLLKKTKKPTTKLALTALKLQRAHLIASYQKKGHTHPDKAPKSAELAENISVIEFLGRDLRLTQQVINKLKTIFSEEKTGIKLSTIHKAKGLENDRVFFLLPDLIPSRYAVLEWQKEQETHLRYIAITRAKKELVYIRKQDTEKTNEKTREGSETD